jgi:hypothetical protein
MPTAWEVWTASSWGLGVWYEDGEPVENAALVQSLASAAVVNVVDAKQVKRPQQLALDTGIHQPITNKLHPTLSRLAEILVSLPTGWLANPEKLHAAKSELEGILQKLEPMSHDTILRFDVQRIIKSLEERAAAAVGARDDSGYESMGQDGASVESDVGSPRSDSAATGGDVVEEEIKTRGVSVEKAESVKKAGSTPAELKAPEMAREVSLKRNLLLGQGRRRCVNGSKSPCRRIIHDSKPNHDRGGESPHH